MSALNLNGNGKIRRKRVTYNRFLVCPTKDFEKWKQRFDTTKKNWHMKYPRDGFTWYNHNCIRKKKTCKYSKSADKLCEGKMKVSEEADKIGLYRLEFNDDGYEHFVSEFNDDSYGNFMPELFEEFDNSMPKPSSSVNEIMFPLEIIDKEVLVDLEVLNSNPAKSGQSQSEQEKKEWDEISKKLMEYVQISPRQVPCSRYRSPEIISVSEDNDRIEWEKLRANSNLKMVIARSTIGLKLDREFYYNYRSMASVKFQQLGVYHHFLGGSNSPTPEEQLQLVTDVLEKVEFKKQKDLFGIAVQTEHNADANPLYFTAQLARFISLVLQNNFMRPIIYCNNNSWKKLIDSSVADELFSKLPLWIARYTDDPNPEYPDTWKSRGIPWWMWQYTNMGKVDGIINHAYFSRRNELYSIQDDLFCSAV